MRTTLFRIASIICGAWLTATYSLLAVRLLRFLSVDLPTYRGWGLMDWLLVIENPVAFWAASAFAEETLFRLPLALVATWRPRWLPAAVTLSCVAFGLGHGGWVMIAVHGVASIVYALVFLAHGGAHGQPARGLLASSMCHFGHNEVMLPLMVRWL